MAPKRKAIHQFRRGVSKPLIQAPKKMNLPEQNFFLLDKFSVQDIERWEKTHQRLYDYYWNEYSYYAHRRSSKTESLRSALLETCSAYTFSSWFRCVSYNYSLMPLSSMGSHTSFLGGRFNIGQVGPGKFPSFPALYLGENEVTALREKFQIKKDNNLFSGEEYALSKNKSSTFVRLEGKLELVLDITKDATLKPFVKQLRKMLPSDELLREAEKLGIHPPDSIRTLKKLKEALTENEWASYPAALDIPANSQIFGLIAKTAGIHAILYSSKFLTGKCLCIFPENISSSESFVKLSDPSPTGVIRSLDKITWKELT